MLRSRMEFAPSGTQGRVPRGAPGAAPSRTRPAIAPKTGAGAGARHSEDVAVGLAAVGEREARDGHVELGARRLGERARREAELAAEGAHAAAATHRLPSMVVSGGVRGEWVSAWLAPTHAPTYALRALTW